jgi:hypothetical protein
VLTKLILLMSKLSREYKWAKYEIMKSYYESLNEYERDKFRELYAAIKIQKNVRKLLCRKRFILLKEVALEIQKNLKGYLARESHWKSVNFLSNDMNNQFFAYHATIIKKHWLGYRCRRNKLDYKERKRYLEIIKRKNEESLAQLQEYALAVQYETDRKKEEEERKYFNHVASNLHHLVSTKSIPGVYNPRYVSEESKPQVFNADVETHLKAVFKSNLKAKGR